MAYNPQYSYQYPQQSYTNPQEVPPPPGTGVDSAPPPPLPVEPPPPGEGVSHTSYTVAPDSASTSQATAAPTYPDYGSAAHYQYGTDPNAAAWAAYHQQQYYQQGQWHQQWQGYPAQPQALYQYPLAQSYLPNGHGAPHGLAPAATPPPAPITLQPPGTPTGGAGASTAGTVPPWSVQQQPSASQAAVSKDSTPKSAQSQLPNGQPVGFYIRPQLPKSKVRSARGPAASPAAAPAYVKVADKAPDTQTASAPAAGNSSWPASLKAYVERAFAQCTRSEDRAGLQEALKQIISDAKTKGELWTRNWDSMPLPNRGAAQELEPPVAPQASSWLQAHRAASQSRQPSASDPSSRWKDDRRRAPSPGYSKRKRMWRASPSPSSSDNDSDTERRRRPSGTEKARRARRADRFRDGASGDALNYQRERASHKERLAALADDAAEVDWEQFVVRGTMQELEKSYFRLTSAPAPSSVRPEAVLRRAYDRLVHILRQGKENYFYALDQFKGMRQDCTVQHLRNDLTVLIYEAHARAALEYGDHAEYNQCQTQLDFLYRNSSFSGCREEFLAYRILYQTAHAKQGESAALLHTLRSAVSSEGSHPAVQHALKVREAVFCHNYTALFRLYGTTPSMGRAVMDIFIDRFRFAALNMVVKAYKPHVPVAFVARILGFLAAARDSERECSSAVAAGISLPGSRHPVFAGKHAPQEDPELAAEECIKWLEEHGAVVTRAAGAKCVDSILDCKSSANQLVMPAPVAVAHGDANLAIEDFLKSVS